MRPVRWGFLGAGFVAQRALAPAVAATASAELASVGARDPDRARALAPGVRASDDYASVLADQDVEAVYVALTNEAHAEWTLRALAAGKHVLCEKPLGLDADEVRTMTGAARDADLLLVEACWNRWHPRTARLVELVRSGRFGVPAEVAATFTFGDVPAGNYRWEPARGGGALYDVGCYAVGLALAVLGDAPATVVAAEARPSSGGVDAATTCVLRAAGTAVRVEVSIDDDERQGFTVTTERARIDLAAPAFTSWHEPSVLTVTDLSGAPVLTETFAACDPYALMLESVSRRIRGDAAAWVLPVDASANVAATLDAVRLVAGP